MFGLMLIVVILSSIWVYIDASEIGVKKTGNRPQTGKFHVDMEPLGWMLCCFLLWIVVFPAYLIKRPELKRRFQPPKPPLIKHAPQAENYEEKLIKLARLKDSGILTDEEFIAKKRMILGLGGQANSVLAALPVGNSNSPNPKESSGAGGKITVILS